MVFTVPLLNVNVTFCVTHVVQRAGGIERDVLRDAIHQHATRAAGGCAQRITDADRVAAAAATVGIVHLREAARGGEVRVAAADESTVGALAHRAATQ